jgi:N-methylhydantoinase A
VSRSPPPGSLSLARGRDPRDVALVAFGGAGPLHAARIVEELGMPEAIIPPVAGNFCAFGLLETDLGYDNARTLVMRRSEAKPEELSVIYRELEDAVTARLLAEGAPADRITLLRGVDMRYAGQLHEVTVPVPDGPFTEAGLALVEKAFHEGHLREFAYQSLGEPTELVTFRVRAVWRVQRPGLREIPSGTLAGALKKRRQVYFYGLERWVECPVYEREKLGQGCEMRGPAIVEEMSSTTLVPPSFVARVDQYGNLRLKVAS